MPHMKLRHFPYYYSLLLFPLEMATHSFKIKYKNNDNEEKGLGYYMIFDVKNQNDPFMIFFHVFEGNNNMFLV